MARGDGDQRPHPVRRPRLCPLLADPSRTGSSWRRLRKAMICCRK
ncbi:hypothetical protein GQ55_2G283000 [Panicum hallii var. hallii]|uniref:Uncharacterized protein n=1 Tax=Panicum hallii var. hallii TaxID=1504633 RepID=A0A2T7ET95_9POAL|nr:hypothetical protein GQ55_2G283000 [Panicum hallii var. hallii]